MKQPKKDIIEEVISTIWVEERNFQAKYDYDTFHSYVFSEQKKYERTIDSLLNLLSKFEKPKIVVVRFFIENRTTLAADTVE